MHMPYGTMYMPCTCHAHILYYAHAHAMGTCHARAMHMPCTCTVPGVEMITVQSYSKNMGLYAERAGVVSFTCVTLPSCPRRDLRLTTAQAHAPLVGPPSPPPRA